MKESEMHHDESLMRSIIFIPHFEQTQGSALIRISQQPIVRQESISPYGSVSSNGTLEEDIAGITREFLTIKSNDLKAKSRFTLGSSYSVPIKTKFIFFIWTFPVSLLPQNSKVKTKSNTDFHKWRTKIRSK